MTTDGTWNTESSTADRLQPQRLARPGDASFIAARPHDEEHRSADADQKQQGQDPAKVEEARIPGHGRFMGGWSRVRVVAVAHKSE